MEFWLAELLPPWKASSESCAIIAPRQQGPAFQWLQACYRRLCNLFANVNAVQLSPHSWPRYTVLVKPIIVGGKGQLPADSQLVGPPIMKLVGLRGAQADHVPGSRRSVNAARHLLWNKLQSSSAGAQSILHRKSKPGKQALGVVFSASEAADIRASLRAAQVWGPSSSERWQLLLNQVSWKRSDMCHPGKRNQRSRCSS